MGNNLPYYTEEEVNLHNTKTSCWIIINDKVYDVTNFKHPVAFDVFGLKDKDGRPKFAGKDCTKDFYLMHNKHSNAHILKDTFLIGILQK